MQDQSTLLEYLPNELFAQIFSYMSGVDTAYAFSQLNKRFQNLIFEFCQFFDFKSISKTKFDRICRPNYTQKWKSLRLSNDDDTPGQIEYFCQFDSLANRCPDLEYLSLLKLKPQQNSNALLDQLQSLTNLYSLTIKRVCGTTMSKLSLPKLKRLVLGSCTNTKWLENCSHLESIELTINDCCCFGIVPIWPLTLKRLKIICNRDYQIELIQKSLTRLSQLINLEIYEKERYRSLPNGQIWEELIRSSLPLLKNFKFYFQSSHWYSSFHDIQQIVASFSTPFYVSEKKWLVQCNVTDGFKIFFIPDNTRRYSSNYFAIPTTSINKNVSIYCNENNKVLSDHFYLYNNVRTLLCEEIRLIPDENLNTIQFINLIINDYFRLTNGIHRLTELRHLEITHDSMISVKDFHCLLDKTPELNSLIVEKFILQRLTENWSHVDICTHLSQKIRRLKLLSNRKQSQNLTRNEFEKIIQIFALKCQNLSISVHSPNNSIGFILRTMSQLHSLHVNIKATYYSSINMTWLKQQQTRFNHSNCFILNNEQDHYFWLSEDLQ